MNTLILKRITVGNMWDTVFSLWGLINVEIVSKWPGSPRVNLIGNGTEIVLTLLLAWIVEIVRL